MLKINMDYLNSIRVKKFAEYLLDISKGLMLAIIGAILAREEFNLLTTIWGFSFSALALFNGLYLIGKN